MPLLQYRWTPPPRPATHAADQQQWLRARIASVVIDWPGVSLEAVACSGDEVTLAVRARDEAAARAFGRAVEAEMGVAVARRVNGER
jgi:hypothetical protein